MSARMSDYLYTHVYVRTNAFTTSASQVADATRFILLEQPATFHSTQEEILGFGGHGDLPLCPAADRDETAPCAGDDGRTRTLTAAAYPRCAYVHVYDLFAYNPYFRNHA